MLATFIKSLGLDILPAIRIFTPSAYPTMPKSTEITNGKGVNLQV